MSRIITKELAEKIIDKLGAIKTTQKGAAHDLYEVWYDEQLIASFGLRHGSAIDQGHDHIPGDIHVGPGFAKLLGQCPKSYDDWIAILRGKNIIEAEEEAAED